MVAAEQIVIQVGGNMTAGDNTTVFSPQRVMAKSGDVVVFNCECQVYIRVFSQVACVLKNKIFYF